MAKRSSKQSSTNILCISIFKDFWRKKSSYNIFQIGLATLLPTSLVWGEAYVLMSSQVVAMVCWGLALAELMVPYSMKLLSIDTQTWLGLAMVGTTALATGLFTCVFLLARRHGSRFSRPQASGYELARQDDLVQVCICTGAAEPG